MKEELQAKQMARIWVDADACPVVIRQIICKAAERAEVETTFMANQKINVPPSRHVRQIQVAGGFDVADDEIARRAQAGDLVVTADIPLAAEVIEKGAHVLSPYGEEYTPANIRARLNMRDFMDTMRASGVDTGGRSAMTQRDRKQFADHLDRYLATIAPAGKQS